MSSSQRSPQGSDLALTRHIQVKARPTVMSDCCSSKKEVACRPKRHACPINDKQYLEVSYNTMLHHVRTPWRQTPKEQPYYFCDDPFCEVVYFGLDNTIITASMLRTKVGIKEAASDSLICYCFGVTKADAISSTEAKSFVVEQTKSARCSCETSNPSGRCCLKDFPK